MRKPPKESIFDPGCAWVAILSVQGAEVLV
jgi:hypothetical protein